MAKSVDFTLLLISGMAYLSNRKHRQLISSMSGLSKVQYLLFTCMCSLILLSSAEPVLQIFPHTNPLLAPTGQSLALMCNGKADEEGEFTEMKWFNPNGEELSESSPNVRKLGSRLKLTFNEPTVADSGTYRCTALFSNTVTLEAEIKVDFYEPIKFEDCPDTQNLVVGLEGRIKCRVVGNPTPSINWEKNQKIVQSDRISIDESGIVISSVSSEDTGSYTIEAFVKETGANEIREIEVNVLTPPEINDLPEDFVVIQGEEYTLTCGATGSPPLTYYWFDPSLRDLSQVDGFKVDQGRLTISKVDRNAGGDYTCKVKNPAGEDQATVRIEVQVRPSIVQLMNLTREESRDALFECKAEGVPKPKMSIRRDNSEMDIMDKPDEGMELEVTDEGAFRVLRLRITNVKRADDGLYYCKASNDAGVAEKVGHLEVQFRPDMSRTHLTSVKTWSSNPANLSCIAEANPNATITWKFQMEPIEQGDERFRIFGGVSYSNLLVLTANRPEYGVFGKYTCEARNTLGESSIDINLDEATVPGPVTQIVFDKVTSTTITFRLMGPGNDGGMPITYYIMRYKISDQPDSTRKVIEWQKDTPNILNNLIPRARYQFSVAARNLVGDGPWKNEEYVMPEETVPEPPILKTKPDEVSQHPDSFEVRWDIPNDNGKPIVKYGIRYFKVERGLKDWTQMEKAVDRSVGADTLTCLLTGLMPDSYYKIEVRATNQIGNSLPEVVVIKTSKGETSDGHTSLISDDFPISLPIIAAIILVALLVTLIILDITCFFRYHCGLLYLLRYRTCSRSPEKMQAGMEEGRACVKEVSTANNGKVKSELKSPSSPDQLPPPPDKLSSFDEKPKTEMDNPAFENRDPRPADLIIDENYKNKSPKGSKTSIGKSSPV